MIVLAIVAERAANAQSLEELDLADDGVRDDLADSDHYIDRLRLPEEVAPTFRPVRSRTMQLAPWRQMIAACRCEDIEVPRVIAHAPSLADVVAAAQRAAGLSESPVRGWQRRSRFSALVPRVIARAGNSESWRDISDPTVSHALSLGGSLAWRLDRLIYDPNEPRFALYELSRRRERRRIAYLAGRAYVAWLEALGLAATVGEDDAAGQLALMQATADLDALTDGWFSHTANTARSP